MILIAAWGGKTYQRFAYNLAHSIKDITDIPICLLTDNENPVDNSIFDIVKVIEAPKDPCLFKISLNKYTPFDKTLYLDADMICFNDITQLIHNISINKFWVDTLRDNESYWLKPDQLNKPHQDTNTSIFYWEKGEESNDYFKLLNKEHKKFKRENYKNVWGKGYIPDESLHTIVLSNKEIYFPHTHPIHYCDHSKPQQVIVKQYFMSMYGAGIATRDSKLIYDRHMDAVMKRAGKAHEFKIDQLYSKKFIGL